MVKADGRGKTKHDDDQMNQRRQELRQHILLFPALSLLRTDFVKNV